MITRLGLVIVLAVSIPSTGSRATADAAPTAGLAKRPLDVVTSAVTRGLAGLRSPPPGLIAGTFAHVRSRITRDDADGVAGEQGTPEIRP